MNFYQLGQKMIKPKDYSEFNHHLDHPFNTNQYMDYLILFNDGEIKRSPFSSSKIVGYKFNKRIRSFTYFIAYKNI